MVNNFNGFSFRTMRRSFVALCRATRSLCRLAGRSCLFCRVNVHVDCLCAQMHLTRVS